MWLWRSQVSTAADVQEQDQQCQPSVQVKDCKPTRWVLGREDLDPEDLF